MSRVLSHVVTNDAQIDEAIARGKAHPPQRAASAAYDRKKDAVIVVLNDGIEVGFPRKMLQGLESATPDELATIEIEGPGTGLYWPHLHVAHYLPGLLDGVFGTRRWLSEMGKRGGASKSARKTATAIVNGSKGGRPRKTAKV